MQWRTVGLPKRVVVALLALVYSVAFVISPYWNLAGSTAARVASLVILVAVGSAWCYFSAGLVQARYTTRGLLYGAALWMLLFILNFRALTSAIPWRGDESAHIFRTQLLARWIPGVWFFGAVLLSGLVFLVAWRSWKWALTIGVVQFGAAICFLAISPAF